MASYSLNLSGQSTIKIPKDLLSKEPTFVIRYWLVAEIISQLSGKNLNKAKIIDVGGNGSLLPDLLSKKIDILDLPDNDYENYIQASALNMPIDDGAYDVVTACDVYEHIPQKDREKFIEELLRISGNYIVLCGPMYKPETAEAEKRANHFFKQLFGRNHLWLEEHIDYTLPNPTALEKGLQEKGINFTKFDHGELLPWELMTKINLLMVERNIAEEKEVAKAIEDMNRRYISELGFGDFTEAGYRTIYIIQKNKNDPPVKIALPSKDLTVSKEICDEAADILKDLTISFRVNRKELSNTKKELAAQRSYSEAVKAEIDAVYNSKGWRLLMILRKLLLPLYKVMKKARLIAALRLAKRLTVKALTKIPLVNQVLGLVRIELQRHRVQRQRDYEYQEWLRRNQITSEELEMQHAQSLNFSYKPLISVIIPTYNTDPRFLEECIGSVVQQSYGNWQICIADDASKNPETRQIIKKYADRYPRIKYVFRKNNGHISEASNSALKLASGEYIALLDHDDVLWPNALYEIVKTLNEQPDTDFIYTDEDKIDESSNVHSEPFFKPDWSPDYLRSLNYITHFAVIKREIIEKAGGFRKGYEGAQDWDLFLRATRIAGEIRHIPKVLYSWRKSSTSTAMNANTKNYAYKNQKKVLLDDAQTRGLNVKSLKWGIPLLMWHSEYAIVGKPKVSIIIPTKDRYEFISKCLKSIKQHTSYKNIEIIVVETGSSEQRVWDLYDEYKTKFKNFQLVQWKKPFNFSIACNFGAEHATGEYLLFLNNDTEVLTKNWIEGMLQYAQQPHSGAVGCKLLYPNKTLQHAGVVLGVGGFGDTPGVAAHVFPAYQDEPVEDWAQALYTGGVRNFSAVTAACVMVAKKKFDKVKGFNPEFKIAFNDVDFCLKLRKAGWYNIYTPYVKLFHHESVSVGVPGSGTRDIATFEKEIQLMGEKWGWDYLGNDPYYSPHFRKDTANFRLNV